MVKKLFQSLSVMSLRQGLAKKTRVHSKVKRWIWRLRDPKWGIILPKACQLKGTNYSVFFSSKYICTAIEFESKHKLAFFLSMVWFIMCKRVQFQSSETWKLKLNPPLSPNPHLAAKMLLIAFCLIINAGIWFIDIILSSSIFGRHRCGTREENSEVRGYSWKWKRLANGRRAVI